VGIFIILVWGCADLAAARPPLRLPLAAAAVLLLSLLGVLTANQVRTWRDSATLYRHALAVTRDNWVAHNNLGVVLARAGDGAGAFRHLSAAISINPDYAAAHNNLGNVFLDHLHNSGRAIACFREALRLDPGFSGARFNLGRALLVAGDHEGARAEYRALLAIDPAQAQRLARLLDLWRPGHAAGS
jgi:Flp pilus assembly protein TadD